MRDAFSWPDLTNAGFELVGAVLNWLNVVALWRHQQVRGVYWPVFAFFTSWGIWNLYYYPHLDQYASFVAGIVMAIANGTWVVLALVYRKQ